MINPDWINYSCQECVKQYPYLKTIITPFAEEIIDKLCIHKNKKVKSTTLKG